ncbi:MAG: hypothetical protein RL113_1114 [Pseudomonadota bacterium]|jgi:uncharacterized protein YqgV (UPF0045/DUF77 family)
MEISVDISLYPLQGEYLEPIQQFIQILKSTEGIDVVCNELSTQIHGDYGVIMDLLKKEIYEVFEQIPHSVFAIKLIGNNRKGIL